MYMTQRERAARIIVPAIGVAMDRRAACLTSPGNAEIAFQPRCPVLGELLDVAFAPPGGLNDALGDPLSSRAVVAVDVGAGLLVGETHDAGRLGIE